MLGFALTVLGRVAARRGDLDTAAGCLDEARGEFVAAELHSDVVHADALRAEALVLAGDAAGALALVEATLTAGRAEDTDVDVPLLERVRGYALAQQGDADQAVVALHAGLESARAQQAEYELALTLDALGRVTGDAGARAHAAGLFARLGVEWIPEVPLSTPRPMTPA
jgi:tetratricopeptide (TPR) repeat protein